MTRLRLRYQWQTDVTLVVYEYDAWMLDVADTGQSECCSQLQADIAFDSVTFQVLKNENDVICKWLTEPTHGV